MTIRKYRVKAIIEKEITVSIDDEVINQQWRKDFSSWMFQIDDNEELLEHVGHTILVNDDNFCEGVGPLDWSHAEQNLKESGVSVGRTDTYTEYEIEEVK